MRSCCLLRCEKIMLASWRGTRYEVVNVLREVCDKVLKDSSVPDQELFLRAKVGGRIPAYMRCHLHPTSGNAHHGRDIQKRSTRRIRRRAKGVGTVRIPFSLLAGITKLVLSMVAEAAAGKSKHHQLQAQAKAAAKQKKHGSHTPTPAVEGAEKDKATPAATSS